ncbi:hypothetical protein Lal_00039358, partial [Lupinus albus]
KSRNSRPSDPFSPGRERQSYKSEKGDLETLIFIFFLPISLPTVAPPKWTIFPSTKPQNSSKPSSCFMVTHLEKLGGEKATMEVGGDEGRCGSFAEQWSLRNLRTYLAPRTFWALQVEDVFVFHLLPPPNSVLLLPPWKARSFVLNSFGNFLNIDIDIDVPCTSLYTCHACTDSELCDSCIDEFLNIVVDSPVTHSHCTNTIDAGIRQQSDLFVQVQAATKPSFSTFFLSVLQAPDWTPPFDLDCDIAVYALGTVLASYEFDFLPP